MLDAGGMGNESEPGPQNLLWIALFKASTELHAQVRRVGQCDSIRKMSREESLENRVRFEHPPVVEVACGVSFAAPAGFRTAHVGLFWKKVRDAFPILEEALPLLQHGESLDRVIEMSFSEFPIPRTWMICDDRSALIQLQRDRLIYNWKATTEPYPSYDAVVVEFEKHLSAFNAFLSEEGIAPVEPNQMELTYVNHIPFSCLEEDKNLLIDHVRSDTGERFLPNPEKFFWSTVYLLPDEAGELQVLAQRARALEDGKDIIRLDMSARGFPVGQMTQRGWLDLAHVWITKGFADLTGSKTQRDLWKRKS